MDDLKKLIRNIPDFPKKGIMFRDITTLLKDGRGFARSIDLLARHYGGKRISKIACIESRGFVVGSALAYKLGAGVVLIRKKGKLPCKTLKQSYELEYGTDTLEMHLDAIKPGERVLVVDDLLATGGTARAVARMIEKSKGALEGMAFLIELTALKGRGKIAGYDVYSIIKY